MYMTNKLICKMFTVGFWTIWVIRRSKQKLRTNRWNSDKRHFNFIIFSAQNLWELIAYPGLISHHLGLHRNERVEFQNAILRMHTASFRDGIAYSGLVHQLGNASGDHRKHIAGVPRGKLWPAGSWVVARPSCIMRTRLDGPASGTAKRSLLHAATSWWPSSTWLREIYRAHDS